MALQNGDTFPVDKKQKKNRRALFGVTYLSMGISMFAIAIGISSTWPYLQRIDYDVKPEFLGWTNFAFNLAAIVGDVLCGRWMHSSSSKEPLIGSMTLLTLSGLIFAIAQGIEGAIGLYVVLLSRIFLGFVRGNMTITRAVISESTTIKERSHAMTNLVLAMTTGFASGSGFQALFALMGERGLYLSSLKLHFNLYTIPAYFIALIGIIHGVVICKFFKPASKTAERRLDTDSHEKPFKGKLMVCVCLISMFAMTNFALSLMETLMIPFIQHQYALTRARAVWFGGLVFSMQGIFAISQQIALRCLIRRFADRFLVAVVYFLVILCFFFYIPMGTAQLKLAEDMTANSTLNASIIGEASIGCPPSYHWCKDTPQIWLPQFLLGAILFALGYSSCLSILISLYTKIVAAKRQGRSVSIISAFGNIGRLTAPIIGSACYVNIGPRYTFAFICFLLTTFYILFLFLYKKMIPEPLPEQKLIGENSEDELMDFSRNRILIVTPV